MPFFAPPVERLIEEFAKLPGIGNKTAQRLAFYIMNQPKETAESFAQALLDAKEKVYTCKVCQNLTDTEEEGHRRHGRRHARSVLSDAILCTAGRTAH